MAIKTKSLEPMAAARISGLRLPWWSAALLIIGIGWGVRLALHDFHGLEGDDAFALVLTRTDLGPLLDGLRRQQLDVHPPLYYVLLKGWIALAGESLLALRGLNIGLTALTGALLMQVVLRLGGRRAALSAGLLWCSAPLLHFVDYTVRMYSLLALWSILSLACWLAYARARRPGAQRRAWLGLGLSVLAALYTHIYGGLIAAGCALALLVVMLGQRRWWWGAAGLALIGAAGLLFLPFGVPMVERFLSGGELGAQAGVALRLPAAMPGQLLHTLTLHRLPAAPLLALVWPLLLAVLGVTLWRQPAVRPLLIILGVCLAGSLALAVLSSVARPRYIAPFVPLWLAVLALGIAGLPRRGHLAALTLALGLSGSGLLANLERAAYDDWPAAAAFIAAHQQPGDVIVIIPDWGAKAFTYHDTSGLPVRALLSEVDATVDLEALLPAAVGAAPRVWFVRYQVDISDPANRADAWFQARAPLVTAVYPNAIQVKLYDFAPRPPALPPGARPLDAQFGAALAVRGAWLPVTRGAAQETRLHPPSNWVQGTLYLEALQPASPYRLRVRLTDFTGAVWGGALERENDLLARLPLATWMPGDIMRVGFDLNLNPTTPPGLYQVEVMLLDEAGQPIAASGTDAGAFWVIAGHFTVE